MKTNLPRKRKNAMVTKERSRYLAWIPAALNSHVVTDARATCVGWILEVPKSRATLTARSGLPF